MKIFIASSTEAQKDMREISSWLEEINGTEVLPWDEPTLFLPGGNTFSELREIANGVDAAIFIFSEDDKIWYREDALSYPRDNVLVEYGLFSGLLGPKRAIICRKGNAKTPTDLRGIVIVDISEGKRHFARRKLLAWVQRLQNTVLQRS